MSSLTTVIGSLTAAALLAACGGGEGGDRPRAQFREINVEPVTIAAAPAQAPTASSAPSAPSAPREPQLRSTPAPNSATLLVEDESGYSGSVYQLYPALGRGYPELKVVLSIPRPADPVRGVPVPSQCTSPGYCEYHLDKLHSLNLSSDEMVALVARGDSVAVVARTLNVAKPTVVNLTYSINGHPVTNKRIELYPAE